VLRVKRARNPDAVCLAEIERFIDRMGQARVPVLMCGVRNDMVKAIDASGMMDRLGPDRLFVFPEYDKVWTSTLEAVQFAYELVGGDGGEGEGWSYRT
jgi:SulP family sulfate permease